MHKVAGSNPAGNKHIFRHLSVFLLLLTLMTHIEEVGSYGVMVSTLDFESSDPSSNLGRTSHNLTPWRNGSASDSRSEGCVFESGRGQNLFPTIWLWHFCPKSMPPMRIEFMTFGLQDQRSATEPWTYRTAADCSTTELYPQELRVSGWCGGGRCLAGLVCVCAVVLQSVWVEESCIVSSRVI